MYLKIILLPTVACAPYFMGNTGPEVLQSPVSSTNAPSHCYSILLAGGKDPVGQADVHLEEVFLGRRFLLQQCILGDFSTGASFEKQETTETLSRVDDSEESFSPALALWT